MIISAIAAVAQNNVIGRENTIPWYLPADLKYFKKTTLHHHVIMGRKTFRSIGRPLPKRTNIVLSRDPFFTASNILVARSLPEALEIAAANDESEAFIIGGGQIYEMSLPFLDRVYLTVVDLTVEGNVFFPQLDLSQWHLTFNESHPPDEKNQYSYTFKIFEKK